MINIEQILSYYPEQLQKTKKVHIIREYLQFMLLNHLSNSKFAKDLCFIGGTNLRLIHGIDRFSEDLDFDNKNMSKVKFINMTDSLIKHLQNTGLNVVADDKPKDDKLMAYRRNLIFPQFLYNNGLSPFKDAKFLIKIESQDQGVEYKPDIILMKGCGYVFNFPAPPNNVLCSMKIAALLSRKKGRDFYDAMFLLSKTNPDNYNLKDISSDITEIYKPVAEFKQIKLVNKITTDYNIYADKNILRTILRNLINNAIKFTHEKGEISIAAEQQNGNIKLCIQDNGIGMDQKKLKNIFSIEKDKSLGTKGEKGNGLGLFFCKEFALKNQGDIWVESELGKGSVFYFTVPKSK